MSFSWPKSKLADICEHSAFGPRFSSSLYAEDGNVATLRTTDIAEDGRIEYSSMPLARLEMARFHHHFLREGDLVITRSGRVGTTAVFRSFPTPVLPGAFLIRFRLRRDVAEPNFYRYFFNSVSGQNLLTSVASGSVQQNLNITSLHELEIPVPPLAVQRAIAHILGTLDDKIELNRRMNATLEAVARGIFKSWFVDFDPVHAKAHGGQPYGMDAATATLFPDAFEESELGPIPAGWELRSLGDVLEVLEVGDRPRGGVADYATGVPSIGAESIVGLRVFDYTETKFVPIEFAAKMKKGHLQDRDVLLYKDGGRPGIFIPHVTMFGDGFPFDHMTINSHVFRARADGRLSQEYLFFWMSSQRILDAMHLLGGGAAIPGINATAVRSLPILIPTPDVGRLFLEAVDSLIRQVFANCSEARTLGRLRDLLLLKLISGEIRVPDLTYNRQGA